MKEKTQENKQFADDIFELRETVRKLQEAKELAEKELKYFQVRSGKSITKDRETGEVTKEQPEKEKEALSSEMAQEPLRPSQNPNQQELQEEHRNTNQIDSKEEIQPITANIGDPNEPQEKILEPEETSDENKEEKAPEEEMEEVTEESSQLSSQPLQEDQAPVYALNKKIIRVK